MSSDGEVNWWEPVAGIIIWVVILVVANELYNRYVAPIVWIRPGDQELALRVVEVVAILLPLLAIFFQILFQRADDGSSQFQDRAEEFLAALTLTFIGLFLAGLFSTGVVLFGGVGVVVGAGLLGLLLALFGLLSVVFSLTTAIRAEYDFESQQQVLGDSTPDVESEREPEDTK